MRINELTEQVIAAAIEVHRTLGPGLLESVYQECLSKELSLRQIPFKRKAGLPVEFKGSRFECGYHIDFLIADTVLIEIKSVEAVLPLHEAQLLTYMKLGGWKVGLLINFNVPLLKQGICRRVLNINEDEDICGAAKISPQNRGERASAEKASITTSLRPPRLRNVTR
jgi:GxxExxY protein